MKHRIRQTLSLIIAFSMLLSLIPLYGAAMIDEFEGLETVEEIPFEFVLEPGDLTRELLREAVLAPEDLPSCIDPELAEARGHVNRLYLQEPDNRTVMFQNRDGSKTVYLFSHPVKGMSASTVSSFEISGTRLSFTFNNAITSRVGVTLSNFNIGYAEVAYIPGGVLTEDGVNITEDVRDWARGESTVSALAYNISGEAAAEYAASVAVPETDAAATAAAAPGITITPNDPAPLGGMTVMAITYDDLAGVMSFKSVSANNYLVLHPNNRSSLMMYPRPISPYSRWVVSYDVTTGFTIANLYQPANKCLGFDDTDSFIIDSLSYMMDTFTLDIESSTDNIVTINCGQIAISSTAALYEKNEDDDYFPTSCQWEIVSKTNYAPVQSITTSRIRTVNAEEPFYEAYTTNPAEPTYSDINLHFASNNQVVPTDSDFDMDDLRAYVIAEPGMYQVYYKDVSSGVRSANFWLNVVQNVQGITPASSVRIEQSGVGFYLDYTVLPELANNYSISLYYASNDEEVDYEEDEDGEPDYYYIDTPGIYSVYYKDSVSGVTSVEFTMIITETSGAGQPVNFPSNRTYAIQPYGYGNLFLTMTDNDGIGTTQNSFSVESLITEWDDQSQTFVFNTATGDSYSRTIFATLSTDQYQAPTYSVSSPTSTYTGTYTLTNKGIINNAICYSTLSDVPIGKTISDIGSIAQIYDIGGYYVIGFGLNNGGQLMALKYDTEADPALRIEVYDPTKTEFRWNISYVGVDTELIKQTHASGCGATAALMFMYGMGLDSAISNLSVENDLLEQQTALLEDIGYNEDEYIYVYQIRNYLTSITSPTIYDHETDDDKMEQIIDCEISRGNIMVAYIDMKIMTYYGTYYHNSTEAKKHYVCIIGKIETSSKTYYILLDPHYSSDHDNDDETPGFFGIHIMENNETFWNATDYLIFDESSNITE